MTAGEEGCVFNLQELFILEILYMSILTIAFVVCSEGKKGYLMLIIHDT